MAGILFLSTMVFTNVVFVYGNTHPYPVFTSCNSTVVDLIKNYWKTTETPTNVLKKIENVGRYVDFHTSYEGINSDFKCNIFKADNNFFNFTLIWNDGSEPFVIQYEVTDSTDGIIRGKPVAPYDDLHHRWTWYVIHLEDGMEASYICNDDHGRPATPLADILVAANSFNNSAVMESAQKMKTLLESWGFKFIFSSVSECFTEHSQ